jgi:hypothetical protein
VVIPSSWSGPTFWTLALARTNCEDVAIAFRHWSIPLVAASCPLNLWFLTFQMYVRDAVHILGWFLNGCVNSTMYAFYSVRDVMVCCNPFHVSSRPVTLTHVHTHSLPNTVELTLPQHLETRMLNRRSNLPRELRHWPSSSMVGSSCRSILGLPWDPILHLVR